MRSLTLGPLLKQWFSQSWLNLGITWGVLIPMSRSQQQGLVSWKIQVTELLFVQSPSLAMGLILETRNQMQQGAKFFLHTCFKTSIFEATILALNNPLPSHIGFWFTRPKDPPTPFSRAISKVSSNPLER